jgi:hypothetical protein
MAEPANDERVFQVLSYESEEHLSKRVSEYLTNDWLLHGTTTFKYNPSRGRFMYMQVVVKYPGYVDR